MHPARQKMNAALKAYVVPRLRAVGFVGTFPHLRRVHDEVAELIVFQFNKYGGSFVVEVATMTADDVASHWKSDLSLDTATVYHSRNRKRICSRGSDHWFVFGKPVGEPGNDTIYPDAHYERVANNVMSLVDFEAAAWWATSNPSVQRTASPPLN